MFSVREKSQVYALHTLHLRLIGMHGDVSTHTSHWPGTGEHLALTPAENLFFKSGLLESGFQHLYRERVNAFACESLKTPGQEDQQLG